MNETQTNDLQNSPAQAAAVAARRIGNGASQAAHDIAQTTTREAGHVGQAAREWWQQHKEDATHTMESAKSRVQQWNVDSQDYVRARPVKSVFLAAGFGMLIGAVWALAARRER